MKTVNKGYERKRRLVDDPIQLDLFYQKKTERLVEGVENSPEASIKSKYTKGRQSLRFYIRIIEYHFPFLRKRPVIHLFRMSWILVRNRI
jgi:hypothetical protein